MPVPLQPTASMFRDFLKTFDILPVSNKSMVYLMWIYSTGFIISSIFLNIYVFGLYSSINHVIIFDVINYSSIILWFVWVGLLMSHFGWNIKNMYYIGYGLFICSFISLFCFEWTLGWVLIFSFLYWLGDGAFWNAMHTQELQNIKDTTREFYSSSIEAGNNLIKILVPLMVSWIFFAGKIFSFNAYTILFLSLPLIFFLSFSFIKNIWDYTPQRISSTDVRDFFNLKRHKYGHFYFLTSGINETLTIFLIPILSIYFLKTEENVWLFQAALTIISTTAIVHLSKKRHVKNRFQFFLFSCVLMAANFVFLWAFFGSLSFVIFSLILLFLEPILWVSYHVYNLSLMDNIQTGDNDFYPSMMGREVLLWIGRIGILWMLAIITNLLGLNLESTFKIGILLCVGSYFFLIWTIYSWERSERSQALNT